MSLATDEARRKMLCDKLGMSILAGGCDIPHAKSQIHDLVAPPPAPPVWDLLNHLKVLHQYTESLADAAAGGPNSTHLFPCPEACQNGLEWLIPLLAPVEPVGEPYASQVRACKEEHSTTETEAAFRLHQNCMLHDINYARIIVRRLLPEPKGYDAEIASNLLLHRPAYEDFKHSLLNWRSDPLYHLLCLSARNMPSACDWVPSDFLHESDDWQDLLDEFNIKCHISPARLEDLTNRLYDRSHNFTNRICSLLDRVAIMARVSSTRPTQCLDDLLPFLLFRRESCPFASCASHWGALKSRISNAIPPSLLCPGNYTPNRPTWGYRRLKLCLNDKGLYIDPGNLEWIDQAFLDQCKPQKLPDRLHDILMRMGEAATSPEVARFMLEPRQFFESDAHTNRQGVLRAMDSVDRPFDSVGWQQCVQRVKDSVPCVKCQALPRPLRLLMWRVDVPPRAILYHGGPEENPPHLLQKTIHRDKVARRTVCGISHLLDDTDTQEAIKRCIRQEVVLPHKEFSAHPLHQVVVRGTPSTATTLAEAVAIFTGPPAENLSRIALHASAKWEAEHVDSRYAEHQQASNGCRFRDWVAVFHDKDREELQRARLAAHELSCQKVFQTHFPLSGKEGCNWVAVASSLPPEHTLIRFQEAKTDMEALKRSVEMRFMNDPKLLPKGERVDKEDMELYSDHRQVVIAYAPKGQMGLEFISFAYPTS